MDNTDNFKHLWQQAANRQAVALSPQKMNAIRDRKPENLIEKIRATAQADQKALPYVTLVLVGALAWYGYYGFCLFIAGMMALLYSHNQRMLQQLGQVALKESVLAYLLDFRSLTRRMVRHYTWIVGGGTLLIGVPVLLFVLEIVGIPMAIFFGPGRNMAALGTLSVGAVLFSGLSILAYRLSVRVLYRKKLRKIDAMIASLRAEA